MQYLCLACALLSSCHRYCSSYFGLQMTLEAIIEHVISKAFPGGMPPESHSCCVFTHTTLTQPPPPTSEVSSYVDCAVAQP